MVGAFAAGKTSMVSRFVHSLFSDKYHTTVGVKVDKKSIDLRGREVVLMLWDLAGEDGFHAVQTKYFRGADGYLLVADGTRRETLDTAETLRRRVEDGAGPLPFVCVVNKADLESEWQVTAGDLDALSARGWAVTRASAKTGVGVEEAFRSLAERLVPGGTGGP